MINFRVIARVLSQVVFVEGLFMLAASLVSFAYDEKAGGLVLAAIITVVTGVLGFTPLRNEEKISGNKEGYIIVTSIWIILSLFGTLPYLLTGTLNNFTDAFFESMSGFTTTGATVITDIEAVNRGVLFWRSLSQWLGGLGFILVSLSLLPVVRSLNIQLPITDFTGQSSEKINPRITEATKRLVFVYVLLTISEIILLTAGKMPLFDAVCNSLSTISTGGFTTRNDGLASFGSPFILLTIIIFMFLGGTNLTLVYFALKGNFRKVTGNSEFLFYLSTSVSFIVLVSLLLWMGKGIPAGKAFLDGSFHVISVMTTTGFYSLNYGMWGGFLMLIFFILMFTGGSSGSAGSSLKIIRLLIITKNTRHEIRKMIHPNAVIPVRIDQKTVPDTHVYNILVFTTLYFVLICLSSLVISFMDYDIITSVSTSAAMMGNIGPGIGTFGPFSTYSGMPWAGKYFLTFLMLVGRLELFSVLALLSVSFYRR
jgi:trk system potassium uptake protein TrkH